MSDRRELLRAGVQMRVEEDCGEGGPRIYGGATVFTSYMADGELTVQCTVDETPPGLNFDAELVDEDNFKLDKLTVEEICASAEGAPVERVRMAAHEMLDADRYRALCAEYERFMGETAETEISELGRFKHFICMAMQAEVAPGELTIELSPALYLAHELPEDLLEGLEERRQLLYSRATAVSLGWMTHDMVLMKEREEGLGEFSERCVITMHMVGCAIREGVQAVRNTLDLGRFV